MYSSENTSNILGKKKSNKNEIQKYYKPYVYIHFVFDKGAKTIYLDRIIFVINWCWDSIQKNKVGRYPHTI